MTSIASMVSVDVYAQQDAHEVSCVWILPITSGTSARKLRGYLAPAPLLLVAAPNLPVPRDTSPITPPTVWPTPLSAGARESLGAPARDEVWHGLGGSVGELLRHELLG